MKHFLEPEDEKRSIVVLKESQYLPWLNANQETAKNLLQISQVGFLISEKAPRL